MRFPEFQGEWEEIRLEDIATYENGKAHENNISEFGKYIVVNSKFISTEGRVAKYSDEVFCLADKNDILMVLSDLPNGKALSKCFFVDSNNKYAVNQRICKLRPNTTDALMTFYMLNRNAYYLSFDDGVNQTNLKKEDVLNCILFSPKSPAEQKKIGAFLSLIDKRIETQNKIIKELETLMKGLCNDLFSRKFRFKDEHGNIYPDWKATKLRNVMSVPEKIKPAFVDKNKLLTVKLHTKGVCKNENTETLSLGATNYFSRKKGQFIYGKQNLFNGAFGLISNELDGYLSSADVPTLDINTQKLNGVFLVYYFSRKPFYKKLESMASGSGSKRIHEAALLDIEIHLPTLEEQNKIASSLSVIAERIKLELDQYDLLSKQKKYLLNQMFI